MGKVLIVIPALNPQNMLIDYIDALISKDFESILVINDGSRFEFANIFSEISTRPEVKIINHAVNLGKGRAIKNSINYFLNLGDVSQYSGLITVDSDGQHNVSDVEKIRDGMLLQADKLYLGSRNFNKENVPIKSSFGNKFSSGLFKLLYGKKIMDTQTGLRGIPKGIAAEFIDLKGERFEYETNMLIAAVMKDFDIKEIEIETIYFDNNSETHFRPIKDSLSIMGLLLGSFVKYTISSFSSFILDIGLFQILISLLGGWDASSRILVATIGARIGSSLFNYKVNKNFVFENTNNDKSIMVKYFALVIIQLFISAIIVTQVYRFTNIQESIVKTLVDAFLFFISFRIQKFLVFK